MEIASLVVIAILVEAIWENLKMVWQKGKFNVNMLGALILGIALCILTKIDIFPIVGLNMTIPFAGSIFTGIIVSRGANFVNDLFKKVRGE